MVSGGPKFYVTTPIYYANAKPHLGSLYSTVLADVAARIHKMSGKETFLLTGTDEHGQKIAQAAEALGKTPQQLVDQESQEFKKLWDVYGIRYNHFIRTTDESHVRGVQAWILQLIKQGDIYKGTYSGWYCVPCETYVADKDVEIGVVPQCISCSRPTTELSEESYFFRLSAYQDKLLAFYKDHPDFITPVERMQEVISFVVGGLKDLSISRTTVTWGIPFPGDERHKVYVWADALNNYITGVGYPHNMPEFNYWWPADLHVLGKDIVRFHAVYWPAFLMATDLPLPLRLLVHGWIKVGEQKMSKSLGNVIDPFTLAQTYGPDQVRYYLIRHMSITQDSPFSREDLEKRLNSDLANDLGNLLNRMLTLALKHGLSTVIAPSQLQGPELDLRDKLWSMLNDFSIDMEDYFFNRAYLHVWKFISSVNAYFHTQEPWKLADKEPERFKAVISATCHSLYAIALTVWPVMPRKMEELLAALGASWEPGTNVFERLSVDAWLKTFTLQPHVPLFERYETATQTPEPPCQEKTSCPASYASFDDFLRIELRVGTIEDCQEIPKSDKLYKLTVDFGSLGKRLICSGIKQYFKPEELISRQAVFVYNLQPRAIMGIQSQGMLLTAQDTDNKLSLVTTTKPVVNGSLLK